MESHLSEEALWASSLAARLRLLQSSFADDDPHTRRDYIAQEIERALKGSVPEKREALLRSLAAYFPTGEILPSQGDVGPLSPAAEETPDALLERLLRLIPSLPPAEQGQLTQRLQDSGLAGQSAHGEFAATPELLKRLGLQAERALDAERAAKGLALLTDMVLTLDQLVWTLWRQIAPKSMVRKEGELLKLMSEYLAGNQEVSTAQLQQTLERSRKLIAGLLGAVGRAGATYARERSRIFDPSAIEADARAEKKWNESVEFACWRKYVQLCKEYGAEAAIEKSLQEAVVRAAENLIMGRPVG